MRLRTSFCALSWVWVGMRQPFCPAEEEKLVH